MVVAPSIHSRSRTPSKCSLGGCRGPLGGSKIPGGSLQSTAWRMPLVRSVHGWSKARADLFVSAWTRLD
jgi:hypothetical protein